MSEKARILIVDDEPELLEILEAQLEMAGYDVTCAGSGAEAVEEARRAPFDLLLTDFKMPGMDGLSTLAAVTALRPGVRAVLMTGYSSEEVRAAVRARGGALLEKPFDLDELLRVLERASQVQATS
jgi:CheY-like chemotaxis protein